MELDGPYYSVLNFFDRVGKLERIVNMSDLLIANTKKRNDAKVKHTYQYAPNESIVATCKATTFFSHDLTPPAQAHRPKVREAYEAGDRNSDTGNGDGNCRAQNPSIIDNTKAKLSGVQQQANGGLECRAGGFAGPALRRRTAAATAAKPAAGQSCKCGQPTSRLGEAVSAARAAPQGGRRKYRRLQKHCAQVKAKKIHDQLR